MTSRTDDRRTSLAAGLGALDPQHPEYAIRFVDRLLELAVSAGASDVHLQPTKEGLEVRLRIDGALQTIGGFRSGAADPVVRLKVLAGLLTYQTAVPQEGRLRDSDEGVPMRVSTFPTIFGERAVVRVQHPSGGLARLAQLGLEESLTAELCQLMDEQSGAILVAGPAGSGKTTLLYALLREVLERSGGARSVLTVEDPVETVLEGASQTQLDPAAGMNLAAALRSMLRQDPEVLLVGEARDPETAEAIMQASLTGHLILSSIHATDVATAVRRTVEMGLPPYLIRTGLRAMLGLRLLRRLCTACHGGGCDRCTGTGYRGRFPIAQFVRMDSAAGTRLGELLQREATADELSAALRQEGVSSLVDDAQRQVERGMTDRREAYRVLGSAFAESG